MAEWVVELFAVSDRDVSVLVGEYVPQNLEWDIQNSDVGSINFELALSQTWRGQTRGIGRNSFAPTRTDFYLNRHEGSSARTIIGGTLTSVNLNKDRDTVLVAGKDWNSYLQRRIYPFTAEDYVNYNPDNRNGYWDRWPKKWVDVDLQVIVRSILEDMENAITPGGLFGADDSQSLPIILPSSPTGTTARYKIYPGDETTVFDHIKTLSEMNEGFEFDILPISKEFKMWSPRRDPNQGIPVWTITASDLEENGQIIDFDWENDGPEGTVLLGLGTGRHKQGAFWSDPESVRKYRWLDKVYDYGELSNYGTILQKLKDQNDLYPQKKLALQLLNPNFLQPQMYSLQNGARNRIGAQIRVTHDFAPYHKIDAFFRINAIQCSVDNSTNEEMTLELEMVYEPENHGSSSGGISQTE